MEMFSHANFAKTDDGHDANIKRKYRSTLFVARHRRDAIAFSGNSVGFEPFRFSVPLNFGWLRG